MEASKIFKMAPVAVMFQNGRRQLQFSYESGIKYDILDFFNVI